MKIAIFGDSYADVKHLISVPYQKKCWPLKLSNAYEVHNYAQGGSGLKFSYLLVNRQIKNREIKNYDRIIFIASDPRRMYLNEDFHSEAAHIHYHFTKEYFGKFRQNKFRQTAFDYYKYFNNDELLEIENEFYIKNLRDIFGNKLLLLKCYDQYNDNVRDYFDNEIPLYDITLYEDYTIDHKSIAEKLWQDHRLCHFSLPQHEMFYQKIVTWLETGYFSLTKKDIVPVSRETCVEWHTWQKNKSLTKK